MRSRCCAAPVPGRLDWAGRAVLAALIQLLPRSLPRWHQRETEDALNKALARWATAFPGSYLVAEPDGEALIVSDRREGWPHRDIQLTGWRRTAYEALGRPRAASAFLPERTRAVHTDGVSVAKPAVDPGVSGSAVASG